ERGLDVTLQVSNAERLIGRGDDPIRRTGIQRVTFLARADTAYSIILIGKEAVAVHGSVDVRIWSAPTTSDACFDTQRQLAAANAAYAAGQAVSRGEKSDSAIDSAGA